MKRMFNCFRFQFARSRWMLLIFFGFYLLFYVAFLALYYSSVPGDKSGFFSFNFINVGAIFCFVSVGVTYVGFSNSLLLFGNTRRSIFCSEMLHGAIVSALFAAVSVASDLFNPWLAGILHFHTLQYLQLIYPTVSSATVSGVLLWLLWYFSLLCCLSGAALIYGTLQYKFGKIFIVVFWAGFGFLFSFLQILVFGRFQKVLTQAINWFFSCGRSNGIATASLHLLVLGAVFAGIAWLLARRQEMRAGAGA